MMMMMMLMMMILMRMMRTLASFWWWVSRWRPRPLVLPLVHGNSFRHVLQEALPLGSFSKYSQTRLWCFIASMKSYRGMSTIQLQYIKFNFHFCPTCLKALCYAENSLSRSRVKVKVVWWCWGNVNELHICHMEKQTRRENAFSFYWSLPNGASELSFLKKLFYIVKCIYFSDTLNPCA